MSQVPCGTARPLLNASRIILWAVVAGGPVTAQPSGLPVPPVAGLSLVQTLTMKDGDRESVHTVLEVTARGYRWNWSLDELQANGDTMRQAFNYIVDRQALVDLAFGGQGRPISVALIHPDSIWYNQELDGHWSYDPDKATQLLAEAGITDPSSISINFRSYLRRRR